MSRIDPIVKRRENESYFDWKVRLLVGKIEKTIDLSWEEIRDLLGENVNPDHLRKTAYGIYEFYTNTKEHQHGNVTDEDVLSELRIQKLELEKERKKIQSEKSEINKWLREQSRTELFWEKIIDATKNTKKIIVPNYRIQREIGEIDNITGIADSHYGKEIIIKGLDDEVLNAYNTDVFERRMWELLNKIITKLEKENQKHTNFFNLSDSIDGILRMSQLQSLQLGVIDSVMGFADFMTLWLNELSKYVYVDYYATEGNHNEIRPLGSKKGDFPHENTEKLITWYLKSNLKSNPNITIHDNKKLQYVDVVGTKVLATHGQDEKNLIQSVKDYSLLYNKQIHMLLTGHLHNKSENTVGKDGLQNIQTVQYPGIAGVDDFSMLLKRAANAGSSMMLFERGYGRVTTHDFNLL